MSETDVAAVIVDATTLRVTRAGELDSRHRGATKPLLLVSDSAALSQLRDALAIDHELLTRQTVLMTPGVLDLHFFRGHDLRATVAYMPPEIVRWTGWRFDARLREPEQLMKWLTDRGWSGNDAEFTPRSSL